MEALRVFHTIDRNHTGSVSREEFHTKLQKDNELEKLLGVTEDLQGTARSSKAWGQTRIGKFQGTQAMDALLTSVDRDGAVSYTHLTLPTILLV